jgi:phenylacetate-CoA ligase
MNIIITDCNYDPENPHPVFVEMQRVLSSSGINFKVDNYWSDDYARADLIIGADPLYDSEIILDTRVLGQRTLNRFTRLEVALAAHAPVARFCSPADDEALSRWTRDWGDVAVLKYDWSLRRNGVFLWPLSASRRPFPADFKPGGDLFMEFLAGDPFTYKIDAFGGTVLGSWILPTRHMKEPDWQVIYDTNVYWFDPPVETVQAISAVSRRLLPHGAGYVSFDLMRTDDGFRIIEMNTCGVGTSIWKYFPERYAANYSQAILDTLPHLDEIPRYRAIRNRALHERSDLSAAMLKRKVADRSEAPGAGAAAGQSGTSAEKRLYEDLLQTEQQAPKRVARHWQKEATALVRHTLGNVPFYRDRLSSVLRTDGSVDWERWQEIPRTTDYEVAANRERMLSPNLPAVLGAVAHSSAVGANGKSFTITRSMLQLAAESVVQARLYHWFGIEPIATMATLLPAEETTYRSPNWAPQWWSPVSGIEHHGDISWPIADQLRWLRGLGQVYLRTTPSVLRLLAEEVRVLPELSPELNGILTHGGIVTDESRQLCREYLGKDIIDSYRRPEAGTIALRCPASDIYHIQSEICLLEVVGNDGRPCGPGESGEVVITPLYAYAMPLIRYRTGDIAELPPDTFSLTRRCSCGRSLPGIARFLRCNGESAEPSRTKSYSDDGL